jgi:hypothetical protein
MPVGAQIKTGEFTSGLSGSVSTGYSADFSNMGGSDHAWGVGGVASYSGSFYNPGFLSYNVGLYLNQSRANSDYQSISNASGVNVTSSIFGGSEFPGSVTYSKAWNSEGSYAVPGLSNFVTHGNNDAFGIDWSENVPGLPRVSAGFQLGNSDYSVYGSNDTGNSAFRSFHVHSGYEYAGFNVGAYYTTGDSHSLIPQFSTEEEDTQTHSDNSNYGFNVSHRLPMQGSIAGTINRSNWSSQSDGTGSTGTIDLLTAVAAIHPMEKLSVSVSANYSDNLAGQLAEAVVSAGGAAVADTSGGNSNSVDLMSVASYSPAPNLLTSVSFERRSQSYMGEDYAVDSVGGNASYSHPLLNGNFNTAMSLTENIEEQSGEDNVSFSTTENYAGDFAGWHVSTTAGYSQNAQTLLITYMNSSFNYSTNVNRRWGKFRANAGAGGSRTALTAQLGTASVSSSYDAGFGYGSWFTANGSYSKASGQAISTGAGLVSIPIPSPVLDSSLISLYGGEGYSVGVSSAPLKGLILTGSWSKSSNNTSNSGSISANENDEYNALIQYRLRKLDFTSGYTRLAQGFSASGTAPDVISSFYFGVSRWFNFF